MKYLFLLISFFLISTYVAADIEEEFPDVTIETMAYHYTRKPPKNIKPRPNVIIRLCNIECSTSVPLTHERNKDFRDDIAVWSKICKRLWNWLEILLQ